MTISAKKDGVVNMGGFVAMRSEELYKQAMTFFSIVFEGCVTYGGMSGRDMDRWPWDWTRTPNSNNSTPASGR